MMQKAPTPTVETPRTELEIIPPGANSDSASRVWISDRRYRTVHIQVARVGPVGMVLLVLFIGVVVVTGLFFLLGAALIGVATVSALIVGGLVAGLLRRLFRR